jgi:hypothetical protein
MTYEISQNEKTILTVIRELRPYESVSIQKDANGKPDFFIINREQKVFLTDLTNKKLSTG